MQTVKFGNENIMFLGEVLKEIKPRNILLLTGKKSFVSSGAEKLILPYLIGYNYVQFSDFEENPKISDVEIIIDNIVSDCDLIIAIGGGTVMDMAKLVNFFKVKKRPYKNKFFDSLPKIDRIHMVAIPSTSGTGSEATHFAVVYSDGKKYSVADENLLPEYVLLLPELTYNNPKYLTAVTGIDAFSQALESFWSINSTQESIKYSKEAIKLIWDNLPKSIYSSNSENRKNMVIGSNLAGQAINITKTTAPHALSYGFTTHCGLPHGHAVALFLPSFANIHCNVNKANCNDKRGEIWVKSIMKEIAFLLETDKYSLGYDIADFIKSCGIDINYNSLGIDNLLFKKSMEKISAERLVNNPVKLKYATLIGLYNSSFNNGI